MPETRHIAFVATSKPMLHLLLDNGPDAVGGAELQQLLHARHLVARGWEVTFFVGNYDGVPKQATADGMRIVRSPLPPPGGVAGRVIGLRDFLHLLATVDADIYLMRGLTGQTGVITWFCRRAGKSFIFWLASNTDASAAFSKNSKLGTIERFLARYGMRHASEIVVQTEDQQELLSRYTGREGVLIRNVCPVKPLSRAQAPKDIFTPSRALWVGSIQEVKRPYMLIELARIVPEQQFVMIGGPRPGREKYAAEVVAEAQTVPNLDYVGFVPYEQIGDYFRQASVLVNTSTPRREGFPNTYLEAWAHGLPVLATCDPDSVIDRFGAGRVCTDVDDLAAAVRDLSADTNLWHRCSQAAVSYVQRYHNQEVVFKALDELVTRALHNG